MSSEGESDQDAVENAGNDNNAQAVAADPAEAAPSPSDENVESETKSVAAAGSGGEAGDVAASAGASDNAGKEEQEATDAEGDHEGHEPTYPPSKDLTLEDVHNPRNLTWDELEMHLYEWEEEATSVNEYLDMRVIEKLRHGWEDDGWEEESEDEEEEEEKPKSWLSRLKNTAHHDDGSKTKVEFKKGPTHYLNLTDDAAHVVEFYAPWCPHCQDYKWDYVEVAAEVQRRSITPVQFHAVSCDVYYAICATYTIGGFPTILGWKVGDSKAIRGIEMNEDENIEPDMVGEMLELDMAHEAVQLFDWGIEGEEKKNAIMEKLTQQGHRAAAKKLSWHEHEPHTHNDRYHNAALSLAFAIKSQLFQTVTADGKVETKRKRALVDFLNLLEWASPQSWKLRTGFVKELQWKVDTDAVKDRGAVESLIDGDMDRHRSLGTEDIWGFVNAGGRGWKGKVFGRPQEELVKEDKHWTKTCTHSVPAKGFTCGLWNLFHILTIGSSKPEHEMYGFYRSYFVSPHHVAETIRNFVAYFFSCDVCRTNFLNMYENCGHGHCDRLKSEITTGLTDGSDPSRMELALWLWEVHNSVNARLMKEAALRQNREVTPEETLASNFPTKKMCPDCWLDENMTKWDNATVFRFLDDWYWPNNEPADKQFKSVIAGAAGLEEKIPIDVDIHDDGFRGEKTVKSSTSPSSSLGKGFASLFCFIVFSLLAVAAVQQKRRERRKKFIDSRFVKKKQGCF
eukprot:CAMPEP_0172547888 /NCGR_PEP_ID=MMETSP1067-20121228/17314_1 /TAXON_ID=265564 ORGANISM="Thalassiosira punctigera, Strain Tpunct2005C2" /NCGR_SAMPLE_ID=MMETSP1067 /ASSEMBLY_ACC=CAM_ASM_000444 /LENGTH=736 /DNA_ID=CAMNT_0013335037 /DNA_START=252 /DNA_END=2462 /DNA_ORIENTATION=+